TTGIETAELIKRAAEIVKPDVVIVIDSLAARDIKRINTTIQINDTGISPGSGMGNVRKMLDKETLGCKVIAIGVPTVIDAGTLVIDALSKFENDEDAIDSYLNENGFEMVVTSTDIDTVIKDFSDIIANGINIMLHPGIYS
ncbi:MAG: GPR endopeptidase, partial [Firmicutes bacterium]|nr:GPR endopeptidase [Bacillota bacterium]